MEHFWAQLLGALKALVPFVAYLAAFAAIITLVITLKDRKPRLTLFLKKGEWSDVWEQYVFVTFEVYNRSSRPNAIRQYEIVAIDREGKGTLLEDEEFSLHITSRGEKIVRVVNLSPFSIAPYSGALLHVGSKFQARNFPPNLTLNTKVTDLFGKTYETQTTLRNNFGVRS